MGKYCCERFQESVEKDFIMKADANDETDWFFNDWLHLYYCPFCGDHIKGSGWGEFDIDIKAKKKKLKD